jgi:hypothetical protein
MRWARPGIAICLWTFAAGGALAAVSTDWDGLSRTAGRIEAAGAALEVPATLDLGAITAGDALLLVAPAPLEPDDAASLLRFVRQGGRLALLDEGDGAAPLLNRLGLRSIPAPTTHGRRLGGQSALPVLRTPERGLFRGVRDLVANHPGGFAPAQGSDAPFEPTIRFEDGTAFGYHLRVDEGEAVLLADASLAINLMHDAGDDARLIDNLARWLGADGRRVIMVGPGTEWDGTFGKPPPGGDGFAGDLNQALGALSVPTPAPFAVRLIASMLLAGAVLFVLLVFPGGRRERGWFGAAPTSGSADRLAGAPGAPAHASPLHPRAPETAAPEESR